MIPEADAALSRLLTSQLPDGVAVRLEPPAPVWREDSGGPVVTLFLFGLRTTATGACELSYLVTARAADTRREHLLLDHALRAVRGGGPATRVARTDAGALWSSLGLPARAGFVAVVRRPR
ncbi:hypothetical protein [Amycolatopsis suaedae]|uniref:DUF3168 domain-containing protein n=1 Tax=Amycolatopsis suaedae TaxID=2510978 RepID=A0A4Q7J9B9_9PSEU|nr:hypothetical protein [Amycolatopsis suaedae]RZQ62734.1 hypothetical protein EWH70_17415 [Amycolatopsis suaedae]